MKDRRRYLEFEQDLAKLDEQIAELKSLKIHENVDLTQEIRHLEDKSKQLLQTIFQSLTPYQQVQLSRHPDRPSCLDYIDSIFDDFVMLRGDRNFREDESLITGLADFEGQSVLVMGHQKGRNTQENMRRNFGMARPEAYRKALRLCELAERWQLPVVTFVDTPGAYPGIDAEERGQAEAIAHSILRMSNLKVPIVSVILGEGGSGGALAVAVCDRLLMMEYGIYSVISPEGCASIIWKDAKFAAQASEALRLTARSIHEQGLCDALIAEPLGGAHRDPLQAAMNLKNLLKTHLSELQSIPIEKLLEERYKKYRQINAFKSTVDKAPLAKQSQG